MTTHFKASGGNRAYPLCNTHIDPSDRWSTDPEKVDCPACKSGMPNSYEQPKQMKTWKAWVTGGGNFELDADSLTFEGGFAVFRRSDSIYQAFPAHIISEIRQIEDME